MMETLPPMETLELSDGEPPRKLAILGLPWDTSDETLRVYFSQFGGLEHAEIMKDRYSGKSRGFGFVTFTDASAAQRALLQDHSIDGRRCEAKVALPKGEPSPPRTTRIFVARVPPSVSEAQFRAYFEAFGKLQDAYMPRDHFKQGFRGIGFVTYACPDSVEKVMAVKHWMHGHEIAIDRATPKDEPPASKNMMMSFQRPMMGQRRSFDNGAGIIGPGLTSVMQMSSGLSTIGEGQVSQYPPLSAMSEDCELGANHAAAQQLMTAADRDAASSPYHSPTMSHHDMAGMVHHQQQQQHEMSPLQPQGQSMQSPGSNLRWTAQMGGQQDGRDGQEQGGNNGLAPSDAALRARQALGISFGEMSLHNRSAAAAVAANAAFQTLANVQSAAAHAAAQQMMASERHGPNDGSATYGVGGGSGGLSQLTSLQLAGSAPPMLGLQSLHGLADLSEGQPGGFHFPSMGQGKPPMDMSHPAVHQLMAAAHVAAGQRRSIDNSVINMARRSIGENPAIATARAGPRIFIGKLTKDTTESDVKDYFMRFGYVMDVYLPKSKDNKAEHRGFGFVTFETEAAIQRVVSNGSHRLRGSTIAIDIAMPKVEEESDGTDGSGGRNSFDGNHQQQQYQYQPPPPSNLNSALAGLGAQMPMMPMMQQHM